MRWPRRSTGWRRSSRNTDSSGGTSRGETSLPEGNYGHLVAQMGCVLVTKYHVEFEVEADQEWDVSEGSAVLYSDNSHGYDWWVPSDAKITVIAPSFPSGWYQREGEYGDGSPYGIIHWSTQEIEDYGEEEFSREYRRMHPPVPWTDTTMVGEDSTPEYTDGYYLSSEGVRYRRVDGLWSFKPEGWDNWIASCFNESNIEAPGSVTFVPED